MGVSEGGAPRRKWWGYLHVNGSIQTKPFLEGDEWVLDDAFSSPFCARVFDPFDAEGREDALQKIQAILRKE